MTGCWLQDCTKMTGCLVLLQMWHRVEQVDGVQFFA